MEYQHQGKLFNYSLINFGINNFGFGFGLRFYDELGFHIHIGTIFFDCYIDLNYRT